MRYGCLFLLLLLVLTTTQAQDKIETDRPNQTETPVLVPKHFLQAELGFNKENKENNNYRLLHPTALLRYGAGKRVELRLEAEAITEHTELLSNIKNETGLAPVELGLKVALLGAKGARPQTGMVAQVGLPFLSSPQFRVPHLMPSVRFVVQHKITEALELGYNLGTEWDGESTTPSWLYTFTPGLNLGEKWYTFIEVFGFIAAHQKPQHSMDAGLAYLVSNNLLVDASAGTGLSEKATQNFVSVGISFRRPVR